MNNIVSEDSSQNLKLIDNICNLTKETFSLFCNKEQFSVFHWKSLRKTQHSLDQS